MSKITNWIAEDDRSHEEFADYLERVGADHEESGHEFTAADYREAARRIRELAGAGDDVTPDWERITAADVRVGDLIARTRNEEPAEVLAISRGSSSAYLRLRGAGRIRPQYTSKLWRRGTTN